jgi:hypothetical protein
VLENHHDALAKLRIQPALFHWSKEVLEGFVVGSATAVGKGKSLLGTPSSTGFLNVGCLDVSELRSKVRGTVIVGKPSKEMELSKFASVALIARTKRENIGVAECLERRGKLVSVFYECLKGTWENLLKFRESLHGKRMLCLPTISFLGVDDLAKAILALAFVQEHLAARAWLRGKQLARCVDTPHDESTPRKFRCVSEFLDHRPLGMNGRIAIAAASRP